MARGDRNLDRGLLCLVDRCEEPQRTQELCANHYQHAYRRDMLPITEDVVEFLNELHQDLENPELPSAQGLGWVVGVIDAAGWIDREHRLNVRAKRSVLDDLLKRTGIGSVTSYERRSTWRITAAQTRKLEAVTYSRLDPDEPWEPSEYADDRDELPPGEPPLPQVDPTPTDERPQPLRLG